MELNKTIKDNLEKTDLENEPGFLDIYSAIYSMRQDLDRIRKPIGTKENPGRSCKDLFFGHPQFKDGIFFFFFENRIIWKSLLFT